MKAIYLFYPSEEGQFHSMNRSLCFPAKVNTLPPSLAILPLLIIHCVYYGRFFPEKGSAAAILHVLEPIFLWSTQSNKRRFQTKWVRWGACSMWPEQQEMKVKMIHLIRYTDQRLNKCECSVSIMFLPSAKQSRKTAIFFFVGDADTICLPSYFLGREPFAN